MVKEALQTNLDVDYVVVYKVDKSGMRVVQVLRTVA